MYGSDFFFTDVYLIYTHNVLKYNSVNIKHNDRKISSNHIDLHLSYVFDNIHCRVFLFIYQLILSAKVE